MYDKNQQLETTATYTDSSSSEHMGEHRTHMPTTDDLHEDTSSAEARLDAETQETWPEDDLAGYHDTSSSSANTASHTLEAEPVAEPFEAEPLEDPKASSAAAREMLTNSHKATLRVLEIATQALILQNEYGAVLAEMKKGSLENLPPDCSVISMENGGYFSPALLDRLCSMHKQLRNDLTDIITSLTFQEITGRRLEHIATLTDLKHTLEGLSRAMQTAVPFDKDFGTLEATFSGMLQQEVERAGTEVQRSLAHQASSARHNPQYLHSLPASEEPEAPLTMEDVLKKLGI